MIRYKYSALDEYNKIVEGEIIASDEKEAQKLLIVKGQKPIKIVPDVFSKEYWTGHQIKSISGNEVAIFCKQLSIITKSGISILKGLAMVKNQTSSKRIRELAENVHADIEKGYSLSNAFKNSGYRLPLLLINMVEIGEISGNLDDIFKKMAEYFENETKTRKKVINALIYPMILICVSVGVVILFTFFILPDMIKIITDTGGKLPFVTKFMMSSAKYIQKNIVYITIGVVALVIFYTKILSYKLKTQIKSSLMSLIPGLSGVSKDFVTARFVRTMGLMVKTGLPMLAVLETLEKVSGSEKVSKGIAIVREKINKGESLTTGLEQMGYFDPMVINIIAIGEETGNLDDSLLDLADYYDEKFDSGVSRMISMIEPIFTLGMGGVIGTIVLSSMLPIFNMVGSFSNLNK